MLAKITESVTPQEDRKERSFLKKSLPIQFLIFLLIFHQFLFLHSHKIQIEELHLISTHIPPQNIERVSEDTSMFIDIAKYYYQLNIVIIISKYDLP